MVQRRLRANIRHVILDYGRLAIHFEHSANCTTKQNRLLHSPWKSTRESNLFIRSTSVSFPSSSCRTDAPCRTKTKSVHCSATATASDVAASKRTKYGRLSTRYAKRTPHQQLRAYRQVSPRCHIPTPRGHAPLDDQCAHGRTLLAIAPARGSYGMACAAR